MLDTLKSKVRRLGAGWYWPLVLLALPNCFLDASGIGPDHAFDPGDPPQTGAVMCQIPVPSDWECVPQGEDPMGVRLEDAATALYFGEKSIFALDFSPDKTAVCPGGQPQRRQFNGFFPDGVVVCLNCDQQVGPAKTYADNNAVCVAKCKDLINFGEDTAPPEGTDAFCEANAHVATNMPLHFC